MEDKNGTNSVTSKVEGRDLIFERIFDAPRELVFKVFSEAKHLEKWWGPKGWQTEIREFNFKPGGVWHFCTKCTDENQEMYGYESWGKAIFHEIAEPERIIYTDVFSDEAGNQADGMPEQLVTITFTEHEGKTKLTSRTQFSSVEELQSVLDMGVVEGLTSTWDCLDEHLQEIG